MKKADEAGLVESSEGEPVLEEDLKIKSCLPDPEPHSDEDLDWTPESRRRDSRLGVLPFPAVGEPQRG